MSPRPTSRRRVALVVAAALLALGGLTGLPLLNQIASAHTLPTAGAIDPVARAAAEFAPSRQGDRLDAASVAEERKAELQVGTPAPAADDIAQARNADLSVVVQQLATAAQTEELKRVFDIRAGQEARRRSQPVSYTGIQGITTPTAEKVFANDAAASGKVVSPATLGSYTVSAGFGATGLWYPYHTGQDFAAVAGTPAYAVADAIVGVSLNDWWAGNNVVLYHADGSSSVYAHLNDVAVAPGTVVHAGDLVGHVGNTGRSYGAHLHFEYYPANTIPGDNYRATDPAAWLRSHGVAI